MRVVLDVDPGTDDALAILMALNAPDLRIEGVTTVGGNATLKDTTRNTLRVLEYVGVDVKSAVVGEGIPVARGAARPMRGRYHYGYYYHGPAGLGVRLPSPRSGPYPLRAADLLVELAESGRERLTVIALGPLTNVARALRRSPRLADQVERIVVMGGAVETPGNVTAHAEFNTYNDPTAAAEVFESGAPVTLVPLDVCGMATVGRGDLPWVTGTSRAALLARRVLRNWFDGHLDRERYDLCDPLAVAAALRPDLFRFRRASIAVETEDADLYGKTTASYGQGGVDVALGVDADGAKRLMLDLLGSAQDSFEARRRTP